MAVGNQATDQIDQEVSHAALPGRFDLGNVLQSVVAGLNNRPFPQQQLVFQRLLCPPDGQVLDPYLGSGSTMVASAIEGRSCTGIDISEEYCQSARERVARTITQSETRSSKEDRR